MEDSSFFFFVIYLNIFFWKLTFIVHKWALNSKFSHHPKCKFCFMIAVTTVTIYFLWKTYRGFRAFLSALQKICWLRGTSRTFMFWIFAFDYSIQTCITMCYRWHKVFDNFVEYEKVTVRMICFWCRKKFMINDCIYDSDCT